MGHILGKFAYSMMSTSISCLQSESLVGNIRCFGKLCVAVLVYFVLL